MLLSLEMCNGGVGVGVSKASLPGGEKWPALPVKLGYWPLQTI
jgi:hypothetical protein